MLHQSGLVKVLVLILKPRCLFVIQLMELQSRFGTDERFRMDSRFLEDEEEEEETG